MQRKIIFNIILVVFVCSGVLLGFLYFLGDRAEFLQTQITVSNTEDVGFKEEIVINFANPIASTANLSQYLEILPQTAVKYKWENSNKTLKIIPENSWEAETKYAINIQGLRNIFLVNNHRKLNFATVAYPKVKEFYPKNNEDNIIIDIESPGIITFDKSLEGFNLKVAVYPSKKLSYNINDEKNVVHFAFKDGYERGEKYKITLYVKSKEAGKEKYKEIYATSFKTETPLPEEWDKDFQRRLTQAKQYTKAIIKEGKYIDIDLSVQIMTIFEEGEIIDSFLISSGKQGMNTPKGSFNIINKHPRPWSSQYGLYMPYWMAIVPSGKYGIHELPEWPGGYKEGQNHLGIPVSHGCVRLGVGSAGKVYNWAEIGTPVVVH